MKSTRISVLNSEHGQGWWTHYSYAEHVTHALILARRLFGKAGMGSDRTWFYRTRHERVSSAPDVIRRTWCDIYFKDPKDATWFQLKKDSLSFQMC